MKKIVCVEPGTIVEGTLLKSGDVSQKDRKDVTKDCVIAVMQHLSCFEAFSSEGAAGYAWNKIGSDKGKIQLALFDTDKFTLMPNGSV